MKWYLMVWRKYAEFDGRSRRTEYWMFALINLLALLVLAAIGFAGFAISNSYVLFILAGVYYLAALIPSLAVSVRRFHDTGKSGWLLGVLIVLCIIPFAGIIAGIVQLVFLCTDSDPGTNQYGSNPKSPEPINAGECLKAAEQGDASAQYNLAIMYDQGQSVSVDYEKAAFWYRKAAELGFVSAQLNLGAAYYEGQGVPRDFAQAAAWFHKAAVQGDATAQFNLGAAYCDGQGVPQDYAEAYFWLSLAASCKSDRISAEEVARLRADAISHLADEALPQAQERVREFLEEHPSPTAGDSAPVETTARKSPWPSVVGWILIVIGLLGGLHQLTTGGESLETVLVTMALFLVGGIGLIIRSGKFAGIGIALTLLVGLIAVFIVGGTKEETVAELRMGACGFDRGGKAKTGKAFRTKGVVTAVYESDPHSYALEDATGGLMIISNTKLPSPSINESVDVVGLMECPPAGAVEGPVFLEAHRSPGRILPETARGIAAKTAIAKIEDALRHFKDDTGTYPSNAQGLDALRVRPKNVKNWRGPYLQEPIPKDPWGHDYVYRCPGEHGSGPDVLSVGANGQLAGQAANGNSQTH